MNNILNVGDKFDDLILHTPKAIQGGNAYIAQLSINNSGVIFQTPKCISKKGVHKTNKQIYTDMLFTDYDYNFLEWIQTLEERVRELIYEKRGTWWSQEDDDDELTKEDIQYNWIDTIKNYKKKYLIRTFFPKNLRNYNRAVSVYDDKENELSVDSIVKDSNIISILELNGLKFSATYFTLEFNVRQVMVLSEEELFNKCLIKHSNKRPPLEKTTQNTENVIEDDNDEIYTQDNVANQDEDNEEEDDEIDDEEDNIDSLVITENNENENKNKNENKNENNSTPTNLEENTSNTNDNDKTLVKNNTNPKTNDNLELSEITVDVPENVDKISLKNPNEVYLEIYKKARKKAKEAKLEAVKAFLTMKNIRKQYMLDEIELSDEDSDEEEFLFSEK